MPRIALDADWMRFDEGLACREKDNGLACREKGEIAREKKIYSEEFKEHVKATQRLKLSEAGDKYR